jgi:6-phosphogluconolactonase
LIHSFDDRRNIALPGNKEETIAFCVAHFISIAQKAISSHGSFFVALSGGSTPKRIFEALSSDTYKNQIDWKHVFLFWSDERDVSPHDPDSNYKMAMDSGFSHLPIPKSQIFRMEAERDMEKNALAYEKAIQHTLKGRPFDLIMLGMGEDGHTASLFPGTKALTVTNHLVVANEVPQKDTWRMTFTFPLINSAENINIYVLGDDKKIPVLRSLSNKELHLPIFSVGTKKSKALWILDSGASSELIKSWHPSLKKAL